MVFRAPGLDAKNYRTRFARDFLARFAARSAANAPKF
jgi:hypothetical protein